MEHQYQVKQEIKKGWIIVSILFILLHILSYLVFADRLPDDLAVQWFSSDQPSLLTSKLGYFGISTGLMVLILLIVLINPKYAKKDQLSENNLGTYRIVCSSVFIVLYVVNLLVILINLGTVTMSPLNIALLVVAFSNLLVGIKFTKITPNAFIGLRFPWLLSNYQAWRITHRISAYVWLFLSILSIVLAVAKSVSALLFIVLALAPIVFSTLLSLYIARRYKETN